MSKKSWFFLNTLLQVNLGFQMSVCNPDKGKNMCNRKSKLLHDFCKIEMLNFKIKSKGYHKWISFNINFVNSFYNIHCIPVYKQLYIYTILYKWIGHHTCTAFYPQSMRDLKPHCRGWCCIYPGGASKGQETWSKLVEAAIWRIIITCVNAAY